VRRRCRGLVIYAGRRRRARERVIVDRAVCGVQHGPGCVEVAMPVPAAVRPAPLLPLLARFLFIAAPWAVVVTGRAVCLLAQHVPALVWLVRAVYRWKDARAAGVQSAAAQARARTPRSASMADTTTSPPHG
jgi:hypothetical protein